MPDKVDMIYDLLVQHKNESTTRHTELMAEVKENRERIGSLENSRSRLRGFGAAVAAMGGTVGAFFTKLFE